MQAFRCLEGKTLRPRVLGCIFLYVLLAFGLLQLVKKPLALLLQPTRDFETIFISNTKIPKIIHQTYANHSIPDHWKQAQQSCLDLHPDYEYKFWTDDDANEFISNEYPWFEDTWKSYPHPIQRADALRYFVLVHFGGTYIDLDDGCNYRLDPLLQYPAWLPLTVPIGVSNDVMGSIPHHPFFELVIRALADYNKDWASPYLTVMYSTGPLFLSEMREEYLSLENIHSEEELFTLMPKDYDRDQASMFHSYRGSSWHEDDAKVIFWMGDHWLPLTTLGAAAALAVLSSLWKCYWRVVDTSVAPFRKPSQG
ncbi:hypothetical protein GTA08_BOTSDO04291 [Botryosphaeria dothidea]|uniref:Mannosyl phosphorylinositol ceramide synthase protein n=1 Tax=Botryosphaeria dothidea TaxID=55169 RepID=A0A8H4IUH8_9PEZI|nr:hypothetical protein GTA08_BOTSDO04291 [Botryosphaeria dothidea]